MKRNRIPWALLAAALLSTAPVPPVAAASGAADSAQILVGTWETLVTPDAASGVPPFRQLITFHADGTLVEIDDGAPGPPFPATAGHGAWTRTRSGGFAFTYVNLVYDPATFASNGELRIHGLVQLDHGLGRFAGQIRAIGYDPAGAVIFAADPGPVTGSRIGNERF